MVITYYELELDCNKEEGIDVEKEDTGKELLTKNVIEKRILAFLEHFLGLMNTEVADNWLKMNEYFEFWKVFANSG